MLADMESKDAELTEQVARWWTGRSATKNVNRPVLVKVMKSVVAFLDGIALFMPKAELSAATVEYEFNLRQTDTYWYHS